MKNYGCERKNHRKTVGPIEKDCVASITIKFMNATTSGYWLKFGSVGCGGQSHYPNERKWSSPESL